MKLYAGVWRQILIINVPGVIQVVNGRICICGVTMDNKAICWGNAWQQATVPKSFVPASSTLPRIIFIYINVNIYTSCNIYIQCNIFIGMLLARLPVQP